MTEQVNPCRGPTPFCPGQANGIFSFFLMNICDCIFYSLETRHDLKHEYSKKPGSLQKNNKTKHRGYMGGAELLLQRKRVVEMGKAEAFH